MPTEVPVIACEDVSKTYFSTSARVEALKGVTVSLPSGSPRWWARREAESRPCSASWPGSTSRRAGESCSSTSGHHDALGTATPRAAARVVGYVFQRPADNLVPHLTVAEHIRLANHLGPGPKSSRALSSISSGCGRDDHRPAALSGGEQRAALAFALAAGPRIILADEPTAELDRRSVEDLVSLVRDLAALGVTFVIATHDQAVMSIATHVVELEHGLVKAESDVGVGRRRREVAPLRNETARPAAAPF